MVRTINLSTKDGVLPPDPTWIAFERSDGNTSRLPTNTSADPDSEGNVNFMQPLSLDNPQAIKWRVTVGKGVAAMLNYADRDKKNYVLKSWPDGYQFYDHNKGLSGGNVRHDLYLCGSEFVNRFRSPSEFIPHAAWLLSDSTMTRDNCSCKYCTRKPQREVSDTFGLPTTGGALGGSRLSTGSGQTRDTGRDRKRARTSQAQPRVFFMSTRRSPKVPKWPKGPDQFVLPERINDLRALLCPREFKNRRWARERELVWVKLDKPISLGDGEPILFWPGFVEDIELRTEVSKKEEGEETEMQVDQPVPSHEDSSVENAAQDKNKIESVDVPWTVRHQSYYKIKLVFVIKTILVTDSKILPYQAYAPCNSLVQELQKIPIDIEQIAAKFVTPEEDGNTVPDTDEEKVLKQFEKFDPFPEIGNEDLASSSDPSYVANAAGAFAIAIQQASRLVHFWTPTSGWTFRMNIPSPESMLLSQSSNATQFDLQTYTARLYGADIAKARSSGSPTFVQQRYQGLWWGAERIWMGELVRLKLGRESFVPTGSDGVKKPAGPSLNRKRYIESVLGKEVVSEDAEDTIGAATRATFMRLDGIFTARVPRDDGQGVGIKCRICGPVYELVDDDWEEEGEKTMNESETPTVGLDKGKGKAVDVTPASSGNPPAPEVNDDRPLSNPADAPSDQVLGKRSTSTNPSVAKDDQDMSFWTGPPPETGASGSSSVIVTTALVGADDKSPESNNASSSTLPGVLNANSPYPLPPAPSRYKFRPILNEGFEAVLEIEFLAGRYYPGLFEHHLMKPYLKAAASDPLSPDNLSLWALEGVVAGVHNSMDPVKFKAKRLEMMAEAQKAAVKELMDFWRVKPEEPHVDLSQAEPSQAGQQPDDKPQEETQQIQIEIQTSQTGQSTPVELGSTQMQVKEPEAHLPQPMETSSIQPQAISIV